MQALGLISLEEVLCTSWVQSIYLVGVPQSPSDSVGVGLFLRFYLARWYHRHTSGQKLSFMVELQLYRLLNQTKVERNGGNRAALWHFAAASEK